MFGNLLSRLGMVGGILFSDPRRMLSESNDALLAESGDALLLE